MPSFQYTPAPSTVAYLPSVDTDLTYAQIDEPACFFPLDVPDVVDLILAQAVASAYTLEAAAEITAVLPQYGVPSVVPELFRHGYAAPDPEQIAAMGRLDLVQMYPPDRLALDAEALLMGASAGGQVAVLDWMWANVQRRRPAMFTGGALREYLHLASDAAHHHVLAWWLEHSCIGSGLHSDPAHAHIDQGAADLALQSASARADWPTVRWWLKHWYALPKTGCPARYVPLRVLAACLVDSALTGNLAGLDWWWADAPRSLTDRALTTELSAVVAAAVREGHTPVLDWVLALVSHRKSVRKLDVFASTAIASAVRDGHFNVVVWWEVHIEDPAPYCRDAIEHAVGMGYVAMVDWLWDGLRPSGGSGIKRRSAKPLLTAKALLKASRGGHVSMLEWLWNKRASPRQLFMTAVQTVSDANGLRLLDAVSQSGQAKVLEWWWTKLDRPVALNAYTSRAVDEASANGHLDVLRWWWDMHKALRVPFIYTAAAINSASANGHIPILEWWWSHHGLDEIVLKFNSAALDHASAAGRLDVLRWWRRMQIIIGAELIATPAAMIAATRSGRLDVLDFWYWRSVKNEKIPFCMSLADMADAPDGTQHLMLQWWVKTILPNIRKLPTARAWLLEAAKSMRTVLERATINGDFPLLDVWFDVVDMEPCLKGIYPPPDVTTEATYRGHYHVQLAWLREGLARGALFLPFKDGAGAAFKAGSVKLVAFWWYLAKHHDVSFSVTADDLSVAVRNDYLDVLTWAWARRFDSHESLRSTFYDLEFEAKDVLSQPVLALWHAVFASRGITSPQSAAKAYIGWFVSKNDDGTYALTASARCGNNMPDIFDQIEYDDDIYAAVMPDLYAAMGAQDDYQAEVIESMYSSKQQGGGSSFHYGGDIGLYDYLDADYGQYA
ncbi:hypothetical protein BC828DRAFT_383236 [Blastocladiella britannica]|nr:hypothetical protein BC828DRAFT_383236 [Blastocladiella britannica]